MSDWTFFRRVLIVGAVIVLALLVWELSSVLLLLFGTVLVGLLLSGAADWVSRHIGLPRLAALILVAVLLVGIFVAIGVLFGTQISQQVSDLSKQLPGAVDNLEQRLGLGDISGRLLQQAQSNTSSILFEITSWAGIAINALGNAVLLFISAGYLASNPDLYRRGALKLVPQGQRPEIEDTLDASAAALRQWLLGQLISVVLVGIMMGVGTWWIGLPQPLALGLIAGVTEFIPLLGPIIGAVPVLLIALSQSWTELAWAAGLVLVVQQIESNMITPLIQRRMVSLPPVLTLFAIVAFGVLFGPLGVLFATPLAVFVFVAVNRLYVRELLNEPAEVPGEKQAHEERQQKVEA